MRDPFHGANSLSELDFQRHFLGKTGHNLQTCGVEIHVPRISEVGRVGRGQGRRIRSAVLIGVVRS